MANKKQGLLIGTIAMLVSNIIVKSLGFFYRVVLVRMLGVEGIGLIEMVTPLFSFLLVLSGCGIQPALSQIIASNSTNKYIYLKTAAILLFINGTIITILSFVFAPILIKHLVPDQRIFDCFISILPAIMVICMAAAYRGWFQGQRQVSSIGSSQSIEQITRVAIGIYLASHMLTLGIEKAVTAASIATVFGETTGYLYLLIRFRINETKHLRQEPNYFSMTAAKKLLKFGLPLTAGKLVVSGIMMLQAFMIPIFLQIGGWDIRAATEIYGRFSGVAMSLLHLPGVFTSALSVSVLPAIAESTTYDSNGKYMLQKRINQSLTATSIFTIPGLTLLFLFAEQLCSWVFNSPLAAPILKILTIGGIFLYLEITIISVLQGLGLVKELLLNNIISGLILLTGIAVLTPIPELGISGAAIAVDISWVCGMMLNLLQVKKHTKVKLFWKNIALKPLISILCGIASIFLLKPYIYIYVANEKYVIVILAIIFSCTYFLSLLMTGGMKLSNKTKE